MIYCTARATTLVSLKDPQLHDKAGALLKDKHKTKFHDLYGDYFVSEMERSYGFVALVTLHYNSRLAKNDVETEAIAYLSSIYAGVGAHVRAGARVTHNSSAQFKVQNLYYRPWGTTANPSIASYSHDELHRAWETIKANPDRGKYETAILSSYSQHFQHLKFNQQPVLYEAYAKLEEVVDMYVKLKRDSSHPGVRGYAKALARTNSALKIFERLRYRDIPNARTELVDALKEVKKTVD